MSEYGVIVVWYLLLQVSFDYEIFDCFYEWIFVGGEVVQVFGLLEYFGIVLWVNLDEVVIVVIVSCYMFIFLLIVVKQCLCVFSYVDWFYGVVEKNVEGCLVIICIILCFKVVFEEDIEFVVLIKFYDSVYCNCFVVNLLCLDVIVELEI